MTGGRSQPEEHAMYDLKKYATSATRTLRAKHRRRRQSREFEQALRSASPAMYQELLAAATHQTH
ncbi:MAG: hypothetical protein ABR604_05510 [Jatrophihabitantaceae bacterium]